MAVRHAGFAGGLQHTLEATVFVVTLLVAMVTAMMAGPQLAVDVARWVTGHARMER